MARNTKLYFQLFTLTILLGCLTFSEAQTPTQLIFRKNWETSYNVKANLDAKGMNTENGMRTGGTTSSLTATMTIRCTDVFPTYANFVMIASDAHVSDGTSSSDLVSAFVGKGIHIHNPFKKKKDKMDKHLGHPVTFTQQATGEITNVQFNHKDKGYYNNIKLGFVNALNTRIVPVGTSQVIQEKDVVGSHSSTVTGGAVAFAQAFGDSMVTLQNANVKKTFDQKGFSSFPDPALKPNNVKLQAETQTQIHSQGYVQSSTVNQVVAMVNIGAGVAATQAFENLNMLEMLSESMKRQTATDNPGDLFLSSFGSLNINAQGTPKFFLEVSNDHFALPLLAEETFSGDLFEASVHVHKQMIEEETPAINVEQTLEEIFQNPSERLFKDNSQATIRKMDQVIQYLNADKSSISLLVPHLEAIQDSNNQDSEAVAGLAFYILSGVNSKDSEDLFVNFGFGSQIQNVQKAALLASHSSVFDSENFLNSLIELHNSLPEENEHKSFALLALGSASSRSSSPKLAKEVLVSSAKASLFEGVNEEKVMDALYAIGNAGKSVFENVEEVFELNFQYHQNEKVQGRFVQMLQNSFGLEFKTGDADYPFGKSQHIQFTLGGKTVGGRFEADAFLGTNFNCNQTSFNYKASGKAGVFALLFGKSKEAVGADAEYGQNGGSLLANSAHVRVWGKTIKSMNFPGLGECKTKTYPLAHAAPGFSIKYTVWVSVVPITFSASASLRLQLNWGWQLCPRDLYAEVSISPEATLVFGGDARIDLLIIKAGTGIEGSLGASIVPKAYVKGTQCLIGMAVDMVRDPLSIKMASYAQWKKCKLLIFKCKWGTRREHVWFHWSKPAQTKNLFTKDFKIIKGGK